MAGVFEVFFRSNETMKKIAGTFWGNLEKSEQALDALIPRMMVFVRRSTCVSCCDGLISVDDYDLPAGISPALRATYVTDTSSGPLAIEVPFADKQVLWKMILHSHGREFAEGYIWAKYSESPRDHFWQKLVATVISPFVKAAALVTTKHFLIDQSLVYLFTCIASLPDPSLVWNILAEKEWAMDALPERWTEMEKRLESWLYVSNCPTSAKVDGVLKLPGSPECPLPVVRYYPPNERNRLALLYIGERAAEQSRRRLRAEEIEDEKGRDEAEEAEDTAEVALWDGVPEKIRLIAAHLGLLSWNEDFEKRSHARARRDHARAAEAWDQQHRKRKVPHTI